MTLELIFYFLILLESGFYDELSELTAKKLEEQDEPEEIFIDLAFCASDINRMISVLNEHRARHKEEPDFDVVEKAIFEFLRKLYKSGEYSLLEFVKILYIIGDNGASYDSIFSEPWRSMMCFEDFYRLVEDENITSMINYFLSLEEPVDWLDFTDSEKILECAVKRKPKFFGIFKKRKKMNKND